MGHAHLGGKTVLYLIDGLFSGKHPIDPAPRKWASPPFNGNWACSLLASQDPVAIDSVGLRFPPGGVRRLSAPAAARTTICTRRPWPTTRPRARSTTRIIPRPTKRLASLGVHEHWNNPQEKKYSRNLGTGEGIELVVA